MCLLFNRIDLIGKIKLIFKGVKILEKKFSIIWKGKVSGSHSNNPEKSLWIIVRY